MAQNLVGLTLNNGEYQLQEVLGVGGMATVYRAYARGLDTDVAIKVLAPALSADAGFRERFHDEARNLSHLHHPNLVEVFYYGEERGLVYIVMRMVGAGTLKDRVRALDHPLGAVETARIIVQVSEALQHAHDQGLVHLDIKPANILLGRADWPLLSDFGITRAVGRQKTEKGNDRVAGTPLYMSPEQWRNEELDGRSDQYSLAITAYELLSGQCPYIANTTEELFEAHTRRPPPPPRQINPGSPGPVEDVLIKALAKNPDDRYPTIAEFGHALSDAVERTRGVSLETKEAMARLAPNLLAAFALTLVGPIVASMLPPTRIFGGDVPLAWPFQFVAALLLSLALYGMRWPLLGLLSRALSQVLSRGPVTSRKAAIGSLETIVSLLYLGIFYRLLALPVLGLSRTILPGSAAQILALATTVVVIVVALRLAWRAQQTVGSLLAGLVVGATLTSLAAMPAVVLGAPANFALLGNFEGLVAILTLVLVIAVRPPLHAASVEIIGPFITRLYATANPGASAADLAAQRQRSEPVIRSAVDLVLLLLADLLLRQPIQTALAPVGTPWLGAIVVTAAALLIWLLLALRLRGLAGLSGLALAFLLGAPLLTTLPILDPSLLQQTWPTVLVSWTVAVALTLLVIALRAPAQSFGRRALAARLDRGLLGTQLADSEDAAAERLAAAGQLLDAFFDVALLVLGYWILGVPVGTELAVRTGHTWLPSVFLLGLLVLCGAVIYFRWQAVRAVLDRTGGEAWARRARVLSFASVALVAFAAAGCAAAPAALAMPADVGGYAFAPAMSPASTTAASPALLIAWEQWIPSSPRSDQATYRVVLSCSDGQQFGDYRQAIPVAKDQAIPVGLVSVPSAAGTDCTHWRQEYWSLRGALGIGDAPAASWQNLDVRATVAGDGSVAVVKTERIALTGQVPASLTWDEPIPSGATNLNFASTGLQLPVNPPENTPAPYISLAKGSDPNHQTITLWLGSLVPPVERSLEITYQLAGAEQTVNGRHQVAIPVRSGNGLGPAWAITTQITLPEAMPASAVTLSSEGTPANTTYVNNQTGWFGAANLPPEASFTALISWGGPPPATPTPAPATPAAVVVAPTNTPTPTPTDTAVPPTATSEPTDTPTAVPPPSDTPVPATSTAAPTRTVFPSPTLVPTKTLVPTRTPVPTRTATKAATWTITPTLDTPTPTLVPTNTPPPPPPPPPATNTLVPTRTRRPTRTFTVTPTFTPTITPTVTNTPCPTLTNVTFNVPGFDPLNPGILLKWSSTGGCAPYTVNITAQ
ncbi:MAG TPA: protein kinase, partial [Chloroflexota bacterium]|nr:protein kinase [Chloroflexota bacterium]